MLLLVLVLGNITGIVRNKWAMTGDWQGHGSWSIEPEITTILELMFHYKEKSEKIKVKAGYFYIYFLHSVKEK